MAEASSLPTTDAMNPAGESSQALLRRTKANELFIAVVGPVGAGAGLAAKVIKGYLEQEAVDGIHYEAFIIKASDAIKDWAGARGLPCPGPERRKDVASITLMQDHGDAIRKSAGDNAAVARLAVGAISTKRAASSGKPESELDGRPRAYIIDSLRNPAEVYLLRRIYQDAFTLVGVVCDQDQRAKRLRYNLFDPKDRASPATIQAVAAFMDRDADAPQKHGQHVVDTFHEADYFVDNSKEAGDDIYAGNGMNESLRRLVSLITSQEIDRPDVAETAMHQAHSAKLRSACLSRQVGAALVDRHGAVVAVGTNEVPKSGGGVYGQGFESAGESRCAFREDKFCSSNREQNDIMVELVESFPALLQGRDRKEVLADLRKTRIGGLIEFSRAVHAEMDAILSSARTGVSPRACRLFVSTFPCHYCARHIVSAGIDEVQYIEPYPKSRALKLHSDSITTDAAGWQPPSTDPNRKVLFRPFVGVAPRMYGRVFLKNRDYKDRATGDFALGTLDWGGPSDLSKLRYTDLELKLRSFAS